MARASPAVLVDGLHVRRGSTTALDGVDLTVAPRRVTGLLGPSGSGKTTLLRAILGIQVVHGGTERGPGGPAGRRGPRRRGGYGPPAASPQSAASSASSPGSRRSQPRPACSP